MDQCLELAPALEELGFLWWEEPTDRRGEEAVDNYLRIKSALKTVKVSGGEGQPNRGSLAGFVDRGAYDIVQHGCDDAGVTEAWWMARVAHQRGLLCCAHNWQGGMVTIANAHLMASIPNRFLLESKLGNQLQEADTGTAEKAQKEWVWGCGGEREWESLAPGSWRTSGT